MSLRDLATLAGSTVRFHRLRSVLTMLGILIGITSVILLTSIGEGARLYIIAQLSTFGTDIMSVHPGATRTNGIPSAQGATVRKLTLDDSEAVRRLPEVKAVVPEIVGSARVEWGGRARDVMISGATHEVSEVFRFGARQGSFLPAGDPRKGSAVTVLAPKLKHELFGDANALGERVRIGGRRFLVVGVTEPKGKILGIDLDDRAYIPVAQAQTLFNRDGLFQISIRFAVGAREDDVVSKVRSLLRERHGGEEDFTITTQTQMLAVFGRVMQIVTVAVGGIAGISLVVGAIGILTMMWIGVNERVWEIGLAKSVGATRRQILALFLTEAALLSTLGGLGGVTLGLGIAHLVPFVVPALPVQTPTNYVVLALVVSLGVGLLSGLVPARRAASLDPVEALRAE